MEESKQELDIHFVKGDATAPEAKGNKIIVHICNDVGKWGRGFVLAVSKRWKSPEETYKKSFAEEPKPLLGDVQFVQVTESITVANLIGQHGVRSPRNKSAPPPIRYEAVRQGLSTISQYAKEQNASLHMPRIGCGLAGGEWSEIEGIIVETCVSQHVDVTVYDF